MIDLVLKNDNTRMSRIQTTFFLDVLLILFKTRARGKRGVGVVSGIERLRGTVGEGETSHTLIVYSVVLIFSREYSMNANNINSQHNENDDFITAE